MKLTLHPYQTRAVEFMQRNATASLWLDPGLGKTIISLRAFLDLSKQGLVKNMLVVAPLRPVYSVWPEEIIKWNLPVAYQILHGSKKESALDTEADVYIINFDGLPWLENVYKEINNIPRHVNGKNIINEFDMLIIDETTKIKHANTNRFKILRRSMEAFSRRYGLTGTPTPNGLKDLFGQVFIVAGPVLGHNITQFRRQYFIQSWNGFDYDLRPGADKEIESAVAPFTLRLEARDYLDLPKLVDVTHKVTFDKKLQAAYKKLENDFFIQLESSTIETFSAGALSMKLRQFVNGSVYDADKTVHKIHSLKAEALRDLVDELQGSPLLVAYSFHSDLAQIREVLGDVPAINGKTTAKEADRLIASWNKDEIPVLAVQPQSVSHGLNMQHGTCHHIVWYSLTWDLDAYEQLYQRVLRQGQKAKTIFRHHIIAEKTVDEVVLMTLGLKAKDQKTLLNALKASHK